MQILNGVFCANVMEKGSIAIDLLSKNKQKNGNYSLICAIALTNFLKKFLSVEYFVCNTFPNMNTLHRNKTNVLYLSQVGCQTNSQNSLS